MDNDAQATFRSMDEGTQADWQAIGQHFGPFANGLADRVLTHLRLLDGDYGGFPIDRLQHSLQTATRAHRGGEDEPYVAMALLHDIGDTLGSYNHPDIAAAMLKPFVDARLHWMCEHHGIFQGYYFFHYLGLDRDMREHFRGHEYYDDTARFCELYDQSAFDASYDTAPLDFFEPMVRRLFARPVNSIYMAVAESG
ncbi:MAG: HD domain-containing protein [Sphingomonas bacterium]|nr:HD domain-containing protein [Sphingomonas bacterium]